MASRRDHDFHRLIDVVVSEVQIEDRDSGRVHDPPKLLLSRFHLEDGGNESRAADWDVIYRKIGGSIVIRRLGAMRPMKWSGRRIHRLVIAHHDDALRQPGDNGIDVLNSFHN